MEAKIKKNWEIDISIQKPEKTDHDFSKEETLEALKKALSSTVYLSSNNLHLTDQSGHKIPSIEYYSLINITSKIKKVKTCDQLSELLCHHFSISQIGLYAKSLFPFFEDSIYRTGVILEHKFQDHFQIPGSHLDLDIFFGNYSHSFNGIHRDGANLSFIFSEKRFLFWDFERFRKKSNEFAEKKGLSPTEFSGFYSFPHELQEKLLEESRNSAKVYDLVEGDIIYWPTHGWHIAENLSNKTSLTLNIALYKSDQKQFSDALLISLNQAEHQDKSINCNSFLSQDSLLSEREQDVFLENEYQKLTKKVQLAKDSFKKNRKRLLLNHLSAIGISKRSIELAKEIPTTDSITHISKIEKPLLFKIHTERIDNHFLRCYFFYEAINLLITPKIHKIIEQINNTKVITLDKLKKIDGLNNQDLKNTDKLFNFISSSIAVKKTKT